MKLRSRCCRRRAGGTVCCWSRRAGRGGSGSGRRRDEPLNKRGLNMELDALAAEARARGISYGQLAASTTAQEQKEIVEAWAAKREARIKAERAARAEKAAAEAARPRKKKKKK